MEVWDHCVIYTADDEEPNCGRCDSCNSNLCNKCGPEYWWAHYRREERNPERSKLVRTLEKLGLRGEL